MKEERFSSGTPSKNKISNFGAISPLYPNFIYHPLSLSQFEEKQKSRKDIYIRGLSIHYTYLTRWKCISLYSKGFMHFNVTTWSKSFFAVASTNLLPHASFSASIRLMLSCLELSYQFLKNITRETGVADYYNIILLRQKLIGSYLPLSRGRKESGLVGVWIVWNLEPLASGGQSGPKLIPHVICQFLYTWEKDSERGLIL